MPERDNDAAVGSCADTSGLNDQQIQTRKALKYVDESPHEAQPCSKCRLFKAAPEGETCGTCQVVPGPIHPNGYCTAWMAPG